MALNREVSGARRDQKLHENLDEGIVTGCARHLPRPVEEGRHGPRRDSSHFEVDPELARGALQSMFRLRHGGMR